MCDVVKSNAAKILLETIEKKGIKKVYVAKRMGITSSQLSAILHGRLKFNADIAFKAAFALDESPKIFLRKSYTKCV